MSQSWGVKRRAAEDGLLAGILPPHLPGPIFATLVHFHTPLGIVVPVPVPIPPALRWKRGVPPLPPCPNGGDVSVALAIPCISCGDTVDRLGRALRRRYPIVPWEAVRFPPILRRLDWLHAVHTLQAFLFVVVILMPVAAALFRALIRRDRFFKRMARLKRVRVDCRQNAHDGPQTSLERTKRLWA